MKNRGYTLIELLVVIGIIGVLAAFLLASYSRSQAKARDARRKADLGTIGVSLESYFNDHNAYPTQGEIDFGSPFETYMSKLPNDPDPNKSYCYIPSGTRLSYTLGADYETTMEGVRCTEAGSTPGPAVPPTAGPTATPVITPTPTLTPTPLPDFCYDGRWVERLDLGGEGDCVPESVGQGQYVTGSCASYYCGRITYAPEKLCHKFDSNCPLFTDPMSPWYNQGRRYTTCECRLP